MPMSEFHPAAGGAAAALRRSRVAFPNADVNGYSVVSARPDNRLLFSAQIYAAAGVARLNLPSSRLVCGKSWPVPAYAAQFTPAGDSAKQRRRAAASGARQPKPATF
jgi:hypothetical protein